MLHRHRGVSTQAVVTAIVVIIILSVLFFAVFNPSQSAQPTDGTLSPQELQSSDTDDSQAQAEAETDAQADTQSEDSGGQTATGQGGADALTETQEVDEAALKDSETTEARAVTEQDQEETPSDNSTAPGQSGDAAPLEEATQAQAQEAAPAETYTVTGGDTLYSIARENGMTAAALAEANAISEPDNLRVGQILTLPAQRGPDARSAAEAPSPLQPIDGDDRTYTVQTEDTLYSIARRYRTSVDALAEANGLSDGGALRVGQVLRLPSSATAEPK